VAGFAVEMVASIRLEQVAGFIGIRILTTERHQLLDRGLVACRFDELTIDTPRNRFVRAALESISRIVRRKDIAHRCSCVCQVVQICGMGKG
jgi:5-methylcytosine-specific restriction enzyme subunit McrC